MAQSFSFPRLRLGAVDGPTNRVFTAGDQVVPDVTVSNGVWYRVTVRDAAGVVKNPGAVCTPSSFLATTDNSYTVQPGDTPTTSGTYKFIIETFPGGACTGPPINAATQQFYVVTATAFTNQALTAVTNRFTTAQTAFVRVQGLPTNTANWNVAWLLPSGGTSCFNTNGTDRPDVGVNSFLSSSYLAYPPNDAFADVWNDAASYSADGLGCQGFSTANQGEWKLRLQLGGTNLVTLPVFLLSNDCVAVSISPPVRANCAGAAATFTAVTNGTGPFTLVWRKDGEVIPGVIGTTLNIPNVTVATGGVYSVEVTGPCGTATNAATLFVATPQTPQPLPFQTNCSGDTVTFIAPTNGAGPFTFQWRRTNAPIAGATNNILVLTNVTLASAGDYRVVVTNACNVVTNIGRLTVLPGITVTPLTNLVRYLGTFASFSTTASATSPLGGATNFVWRKDGVIIPGQTSRTLILSNLVIADSGIYTVTASRTNGCEASASAELLVAYCFNSLDVMLVIDRSESMLGEGLTGIPYRDARSAATNFVRNLIFGTNADLVGLASYNRTSTLSMTLTNSAPAAEQAIHSLPNATNGTCISCGLTTAQAELKSPRGRVGALPVIVLLTDGVPKAADGDSPSNVLFYANLAKLAGTRIFTMGLNDGSGTNVDQALLASAASSTNDFFYVNDSSQLTTIFDQISAILCRGPNRIEGPAPSNAVVCAGQTVQFDVSATGCAVFTFAWRRDGVLLVGQTNPSLVLPNVSEADAGVYSVVVSSFCGTVTNSATLTVHPPTFALGSPSQTVCAGANVDFHANAGGAGLTYQWQRNLVPLPGQTNATLSLTNVSPSDAGNYRVIVSGFCGTMPSGTSALTVRTPPALAPLGDFMVCPGTPLNLTTVTNGTGPLSIVWRHDGVVVPGANTPSLNLGAVNAASAGVYAMEVSGPCGSATNFALVTVLTNTTATTLANLTRCAGESAEFTVTPGGTGPFTYVWRHDGQIISGATEATLFLPATGTNDSGAYTVEVTGACGTVTRGATLEVRALTSATPLVDADVCAGAGVTFSTVASGAGPFTFVWRHDGALIEGATNSTVNLLNLSSTNAGTYSVEVTGACNSVTNAASLLVRAPTTATPLADATRCAGVEITFSTSAGGTGPFTYLWRQNGVELPGEISSTLTRTNLGPNEAGVYTVEVAGACGAITNSATLTVLELTAATPLADAVVCEGELHTFSTTVSGAGPQAIVWRHHGVVIEGATNSTLTISNASVADAGSYSVEVTGPCKAVTHAATLVVRLRTTALAPEDATLCEGDEFAAAALFSGTGPFSIVWRRDRLPLAGQTNETLYLPQLSTNDTGNYSVEITGACNSVTNFFTLVVQPRTQVAPLADQLVCPGANAIFQAAVSGAGPFSYQWRRDGVLLAGATNATLLLTNITSAHAGLYTVMVAGECFNAYATGQLALLEFTAATPLVDVVRCAGETATFSTIISGSGPWQIVWRRDGNVLPGETNSSLTLNGLTTNDAGLYAVEVSGACNVVTNTALLTVNSPVTVTPLADASVCAGGAVTFATTPGGTGPFAFIWRHGTNVIEGATNAALTLKNLSLSDVGIYSVEVVGACGAVTNGATLAVLEELAATPFADAVRCAGESVTFTTTISGSGPWQIVWRRDGNVLPGETNSSLTLTSVATNDAGIYSVEISGPCNVVTNTATLTVNSPVTAAPLADATVCAGGAVTFATAPGGTGPFAFVWRSGTNVIEGATNAALTVTNLSLSDAGVYAVEVTGACGAVTNSAALAVLSLTAATPLTNLTVCAGQPAGFATTPSGSGPWTFVWRRNGGALVNETNSSLQLAVTGTNDAGLYSVEISGPCNTVTNSATLAVNALTTASPLADATVCAGELIFLSVQVQGAGPHYYFWRRNGQLIITTPGLIIGSATPADSGVYSVEVIGACNRVTNFATITVRALTTVAPLTNEVRCVGESVGFEAVTTGTGPFTYNWSKDGNLLPGETNAVLARSGLTTNDAGLYSVTVTGACNVVTRSATLTVNETVTATPLADAARCVGEPVNFSTAIGGTGPFAIQWRKDGVALAGETNSSLAFTVVSTNDAGSYSVEIVGACGAVTNAAALTVHPTISLVAVPDQIVCAGEGVTLDSGLNGGGLITFVWRRDGAIISSATNGTLTFTNLTLADSGVYQVEVASPCVTLTNTMRLTVAAPPLALLNQGRCLGDTAVFQATLSTNAPFTFAWRKDGALLPDETNSTLVITGLTVNSSGTYSVEISGACGPITNSANLAVLLPPSVPALTPLLRCAGESAFFNAAVSGAGPLTFAWRKDGLLLPDQTNWFLHLTNVSPADTALYTVEVAGFCASATNSAPLTVSTQPVIAALTNYPVCLGQDALLAPAISGAGEFSKLWRKDGVELPGATNATLFLGAVSNASAGIYTLEVTGACGAATNHTALTLRTNVVVAALADQTVCAGGAATFAASVSGTGPFTFVWKKDGAVLSNITSSTLALTNLFPSDGALYTVEVTTFCNTASASARLTVESSLTATPLTNRTACVGQNVTFGTTAAGGSLFTYLWRRDGVALTNQTNATLVLNNVQLTNAGLYSVEVTGCGRATNSAQLNVTPPVTASLAPAITACACDDLTLAPTNLPPGNYTFTWRKNGALLVGETNAGLYLPMLNMHSPGVYSVEIAGPCNTLTLQTSLQVLNVNSGTWTNADGVITVRDFDTAAPYPSVINVRCAPRTLSQLRVTLMGLTHFFPDDLDIALVAPNGQGIKLMSDNGGGGGNALNNVTLTFTDAAAAFLPNNGFIVPGSYKPTDFNEGVSLPDTFPAPGPAPGFSFATNFAAFLGSNPNGAWRLFVVDDHGGQVGSLTRWMLDFGRNEFVFTNVWLTRPEPLTNGAFAMELRGETGKTYFLEASTNLVNWTIIQTNTLTAPAMKLTDETAAQSGHRFYRASGCR